MSGVNMSYQQVANTIGQASSGAEAKLSKITQTMDPNSTSDLIKMQQAMQEWSMIVGMESNMVKALGDAMKAVSQNIR